MSQFCVEDLLRIGILRYLRRTPTCIYRERSLLLDVKKQMKIIRLFFCLLFTNCGEEQEKRKMKFWIYRIGFVFHRSIY